MLHSGALNPMPPGYASYRKMRGVSSPSRLAGVDRQAEVAPVAHQQQLRDLLHRERQADHAVTAIVRRIRQRVDDRERHLEPVGGGVHLLLGQIELAGADVLVGVET